MHVCTNAVDCTSKALHQGRRIVLFDRRPLLQLLLLLLQERRKEVRKHHCLAL
jgi:hypothetical protein